MRKNSCRDIVRGSQTGLYDVRVSSEVFLFVLLEPILELVEIGCLCERE